MSRVARSAIAAATRAQRAPLTVIFARRQDDWREEDGRSALAGAVTWRYGLHRQRPGAGRPREAAAATQGSRPEEAATLPPPAAADPRGREPLTAGAAPDRLPGVSRSAPGAWRRPSPLARRRRALKPWRKLSQGHRHENDTAGLDTEGHARRHRVPRGPNGRPGPRHAQGPGPPGHPGTRSVLSRLMLYTSRIRWSQAG